MTTSIRYLFCLLLPTVCWAQQGYEMQEFSGTVTAIDPTYRFVLERLTLDVDGREESFLFYPNYGEFISEKVKVGDHVSVKANVNVKLRARINELREKGRFKASFFRDRITEIKIENEWISIDKTSEEKNEKIFINVFLEKKISSVFSLHGAQCGLVFTDGTAAFAEDLRSSILKSAKPGELFSFSGFKLQMKSGYKSPIPGIKEARTLTPLLKKTGSLEALLFKQNHTCIGAKFKVSNKEELKVSFPSEKAMEVSEFLNRENETTIYYGENFDFERNILPKLQALVHGKDTLFIKDFGFYGDSDLKHEHTPIEFEGKITSVSKTSKGNIESVVVASEFFFELNAMMAQQFGHMLQKGKRIAVQGQERVKKIGEIYSKNYRIITVEKITIDGTTFTAYKP